MTIKDHIAALEKEIETKKKELTELRNSVPATPVEDYDLKRPDGTTVKLSELFAAPVAMTGLIFTAGITPFDFLRLKICDHHTIRRIILKKLLPHRNHQHLGTVSQSR